LTRIGTEQFEAVRTVSGVNDTKLSIAKLNQLLLEIVDVGMPLVGIFRGNEVILIARIVDGSIQNQDTSFSYQRLYKCIKSIQKLSIEEF
jgi:hypothetical protein